MLWRLPGRQFAFWGNEIARHPQLFHYPPDAQGFERSSVQIAGKINLIPAAPSPDGRNG
jgi:hypothetical protein